MTKQSHSNQNGASSAGATASLKGTQSSAEGLTPLAGNPLTLVMSASTVQKSPTFQSTPNSEELPPNVVWGKIIQTFAAKLGELGAVEWRGWELADGRKGWGLFFDNQKWLVDPLTKELTPANTTNKGQIK